MRSFGSMLTGAAAAVAATVQAAQLTDRREIGGQTSPMILINVKFPVRPEKLDEWTTLARAYAEAVEAEEGSLFFEWSRSLDDPTVFVAVEGFRDSAAGEAHVGTAHFADLIARGPDLVAEQPSIIYIDAPQVDGWGPMGEISPR